MVKKITKTIGNIIASAAKQSSSNVIPSVAEGSILKIDSSTALRSARNDRVEDTRRNDKLGILFLLFLPMVAISLLLTTPTYALETASTNHTIKLNVYDSTSLITILDYCDQVKADQEANGTYTSESYERLMQECEGGRNTLECLETAIDVSECNDPEDTEDIEDAIEQLEIAEKPGGPTTPRPGGKSLPPNTGSTWYTTIFGKHYAIPLFPFIMLSIATLAGIGLTIFLIRRHIKKNGIVIARSETTKQSSVRAKVSGLLRFARNDEGSGRNDERVRISNPWNKDSYKVTYQQKLIKKHEDDPLTEILDVSQIVKKYRIKYVLWHTVPVIAIVGAFVALVLTTAPTHAESEYADISLTTIGDATLTMINVDKATSGNTTTRGTSITAINTDIHDGGVIDEEGGVYAKYDAPTELTPNLTLTAEQETPGGTMLASVELSGTDQLIIPAEFDSTDIDGENTFAHTVTLTLSDIADIASGAYTIELTYTITANEPPPEPPMGSFDTGCGEHHNGDYSNYKGYVGSMQEFVDTWEIYDYGIATDERNDQDYYICKLPDENVWMLNNLKISLYDVGDNPELSNPGINEDGLKTQTAPDNAGSTTYTEPRYYDPPGSTNDITSNTFYGYLYNWCAATAAGFMAGVGTCTASGTMPDDATTDICPANWRLPTGGNEGEFAW